MNSIIVREYIFALNFIAHIFSLAHNSKYFCSLNLKILFLQVKFSSSEENNYKLEILGNLVKNLKFAAVS